MFEEIRMISKVYHVGMSSSYDQFATSSEGTTSIGMNHFPNALHKLPQSAGYSTVLVDLYYLLALPDSPGGILYLGFRYFTPIPSGLSVYKVDLVAWISGRGGFNFPFALGAAAFC